MPPFIPQVLRRLGSAGLLLALGACDHGLESVTTIDAVCTFDVRVAVLVEVHAPAARRIDSVTVTRRGEQACYLERFQGRLHAEDDADDAGVTEPGLYSCLEQGPGTYVVRVTSGGRSTEQRVEVDGDDCHVKGLARVTFELE